MKSVMMIASVGLLAISVPAYADAAQQQTRAQDYNSSRSNNSSSVVAPDCANHNTTRANRTAPALDADNDGDGIDNDCDSSPD
jgi:hypothetical protein